MRATLTKVLIVGGSGDEGLGGVGPHCCLELDGRERPKPRQVLKVLILRNQVLILRNQGDEHLGLDRAHPAGWRYGWA